MGWTLSTGGDCGVCNITERNCTIQGFRFGIVITGPPGAVARREAAM